MTNSDLLSADGATSINIIRYGYPEEFWIARVRDENTGAVVAQVESEFKWLVRIRAIKAAKDYRKYGVTTFTFGNSESANSKFANIF